jgi:hypothetical protein
MAMSDAIDVSGKWVLSVTATVMKRSTHPTVVLVQNGEALSGEYKSVFGESPVNGSVSGNGVIFDVRVINSANRPNNVHYTGETINPNVMRGSLTTSDPAGTGTFEARRA